MCTYDEEAKVVLDRLGLKLEYGAARSCQINSVDACFGLTLLPVESQMTVLSSKKCSKNCFFNWERKRRRK